jgi:hypothetical protein
MNRPDPSSWLLGCPLGCLAAVCFAGYMMLALLADPSFGRLVLVFLSLLSCSAAFKARVQLRSYQNWKRNWEVMSGAAPELDERRRRSKKRSRIVGGIACWFATLAFIAQTPNAGTTPLGGFFVLVFCGLTLFGLGWLCMRVGRLMRGVAGVAQVKPKGEEVVSVCLPVPAQPLRRRPMTAELPGYCQSLLEGNRETNA